MALSDRIGAQLPYLRRYARALTGSQASGDAFVRATLEAAIADEDVRQQIATSRAALYATFTRIWTSGNVPTGVIPSIDDISASDGEQREQAAQKRLSAIAPTHRQALLLTTLEEFSSTEAAQILDLDAAQIVDLVAQAISEIENETATNVLIIEDEPLIAMQLEGLIEELGHTISGIASTRKQALQLFESRPVGLVLADIQLADGSSGIDAVEDLLKFGQVPVIFITAYPERLLTGERPEPTYLVTKPFREETVRAAISQALFFASSHPLE